MPDAGMFAVADQITVAAHDLAVVLRNEGELAEALMLVEEAQKKPGCEAGTGTYSDAMTLSARM